MTNSNTFSPHTVFTDDTRHHDFSSVRPNTLSHRLTADWEYRAVWELAFVAVLVVAHQVECEWIHTLGETEGDPQPNAKGKKPEHDNKNHWAILVKNVLREENKIEIRDGRRSTTTTTTTVRRQQNKKTLFLLGLPSQVKSPCSLSVKYFSSRSSSQVGHLSEESVPFPYVCTIRTRKWCVCEN